MNSSSPVRVGLVGCGRVAQRIHMRVLNALPGSALVSVAEPDEQTRDYLKRVFPQIQRFANYQDMLRESDISAVVVCLPSHLHAPAAVSALDAGKHVYLEKPVAINELQANSLRQAWERNRCLLMVGLNYRFHPLYLRAKQSNLAGKIGRVVAVQSVFTTMRRELPDWKRRRETGGGVLLDLLSHHADLIPFLVGQRVSRIVGCLTQSRYSELDTATVNMELVDGTPVQSFVSMAAVEEDFVEIIGEEGKVRVERHTNRFRISEGTQPTSRLARARAVANDIGTELGRLRPVESSHRSSLAHFIECVRDGVQPDVSLEDGLRSLGVVLAAERSNLEGGKIPNLDSGIG